MKIIVVIVTAKVITIVIQSGVVNRSQFTEDPCCKYGTLSGALKNSLPVCKDENIGLKSKV